MRLRNIKNAPVIIEANSNVCYTSKPNSWNEVFQNSNPIMIEIGMGKGKFIYELALRNPNINYIGIELAKSVIIRAIEKYNQNPLPNLRLLNCDANNIKEYFNENEVDKIYLNFSDPWPKTRHEKRRLTFRSFLDSYKHILKENGELEFKTDNRTLFEYSLISFNSYHLDFLEINLDLHKPHVNNVNGQEYYEEQKYIVTTEYEDKFISDNKPIYFIKARF